MDEWVARIRTPLVGTDDKNLDFEQARSVFSHSSVSRQGLRSREFDPQRDHHLQSELKYLYVAITRARRNLWIFEQDEQKRAPVFEVLRQCNLARMRASSDLDDSGQTFTDPSSKAEWKSSGNYFYKVGS